MTEMVVTVSKRIHRVSHRLGVILGGVLIAFGIWVGGNYSLTWFEGAGSATWPINSELKPYSGPVIPLTAEEEAELQLGLKQAQALMNARHRKNLHYLGITSLYLIGGGIFLYLVIRALGWIVAGAAKN